MHNYKHIIDAYQIDNPYPLFSAAADLLRIDISSPQPTADEWKKLLQWARKAKRAGQYTTDGIEAILDLIDAKTNSYGTEAIRGYRVTPAYPRYWTDIVGQYVNRGDTYAQTILYDTVKECFIVTSWGNWAEKNGKKYGIL